MRTSCGRRPEKTKIDFEDEIEHFLLGEGGYLVAADIQESAMKELRLLAASYGIGLIRLNAEDPSESEILIPAREHPDIDWDACNRLALENTDFRDFISWVRQFHQTDNARVGDWDLPAAVE